MQKKKAFANIRLKKKKKTLRETVTQENLLIFGKEHRQETYSSHHT